MPRSGRPRVESGTPRPRSSSTASGIKPSPQALSIDGPGERSKTVTVRPACRAAIAVARPAGPAPTTARSIFRSIHGLAAAHPAQPGIGKAGTSDGLGHAQRSHRLGRNKGVGEVEVKRLGPPQLSRRGSRQGPGRQHDDLVEREAGRPQDGGATLLRQLRDLGGGRARRPLDEETQHFAVRALRQPAHRHHTSGANAFDADHRSLDVLGGVIAAADQEDILGAAGEMELTFPNETEVTGVEPTVPQCAGGPLRVAKVPFHERGPAYPYPPDLAGLE